MDAEALSPSVIVQAASLAEGAALEEALEDRWLPTRVLMWALTTTHDATGWPWWQAIAATTAAMRLLTLPVMLAQIKNTYKLSLVGASVGVWVDPCVGGSVGVWVRGCVDPWVCVGGQGWGGRARGALCGVERQSAGLNARPPHPPSPPHRLALRLSG